MIAAANLVDANHPWPGPIPFDESARSYFYGRGEAVEDPDVYAVWGTALALDGKPTAAQILYARASHLFGSTAATRNSVRDQLSELNRGGARSADRVAAALAHLDEPIGDQALGRCDDHVDYGAEGSPATS